MWWCEGEDVVCGGVRREDVVCGGVRGEDVVCGGVKGEDVVCGGVKGEICAASFTHSPSGPPYERHDFHNTRWIKRWSQTVLHVQVDTGGRVRPSTFDFNFPILLSES